MYDDPFDEPMPPDLVDGDEPFSLDDLEALEDHVRGESGGRAGADVGLLYRPDLPMPPGLTPTPAAERILAWRITDLDSAEWAARRFMEAQAVVAKVEVQADVWIQKINAWANKATKRARATMAFMEAHLQDYALRHREETGNATLLLPSAKVGTTARKAKVVVVKPDEFLGWAAQHLPALVRTPDPVPAVSDFRGKVEVGEVLDHYEVVAALTCGHTFTSSLLPVVDGEPPEPPIDLECPECPADGITGDPTVVATETVTVTPVTRTTVVMTGTTREVPGLGIEPATTLPGKVQKP